MKIDLNLEPKDYIKLLVLLGAGAATAMLKGGEDSRIAVLETEVRYVREDVREIKDMLRRRR